MHKPHPAAYHALKVLLVKALVLPTEKVLPPSTSSQSMLKTVVKALALV